MHIHTDFLISFYQTNCNDPQHHEHRQDRPQSSTGCPHYGHQLQAWAPRPPSPPGSPIHWNDTKEEPRKCYAYDSVLLKPKDKNQNQLKKRHIKWSLGGSKCGVSMSSLHGFRTRYPPGMSMCDSTQSAANQDAHASFVPRVLNLGSTA